MGGDLRRRPDGLELLHQVARRDDLDAALAGPTRACRRPRARGRECCSPASTPSRSARRRPATHRGPRRATPDPRTAHRARQSVQIVALDGVHQAARLALGRDVVVPAPGGHLRRVREAGQRLCDRVGPVEVVEQPAVEAGRRETRLNGGDVERHQESIRRARPSWGGKRLIIPSCPALMPARFRRRRVPHSGPPRRLSRYCYA